MDTILSTVLFTDIVESTQLQARLGDHAWKDLVLRHHATVRAALARGVASRWTPPATASTPPSTARPVRSGAPSKPHSGRDLGLEIRAGVHTGEVRPDRRQVRRDRRHDRGPDQRSPALRGSCLQTVKDLIAGSGFTFDEVGEHELKGVPGRWRLFSAS